MNDVHSIGSGSDHVGSLAGSCRSRPSRRRGRLAAAFCGGGGRCCSSSLPCSVASGSRSPVPSLLSVGQPLAAVARAPTATAAAGTRATSAAAAGTAADDERVSSIGMDLDLQEALEEALLGGAPEGDDASSSSGMSSHGADPEPEPAAPGAGMAAPAAPGAGRAASADAVVLLDSEPSSSFSPGRGPQFWQRAGCHAACTVSRA